jgi:hypothetical protein
MPDTTQVSGFAAASQQIAGKPAPMYGLAHTVNPLFEHRYPVASMY